MAEADAQDTPKSKPFNVIKVSRSTFNTESIHII